MKKKKVNKEKKASDEDLIYIRFEPEEGIDSKRELLLLELNSLKAAQTIKKHHEIRAKELQKKISLHNKIKALHTDVRKAQNLLPKLKVPEILQKEKEIEKIREKGKKIEKKYSDNIDSQLQEIQGRLATLKG